MKNFAKKWLLPPGISRWVRDASPSVKALWGGQPSRIVGPSFDPAGKEAASLEKLQIAPYGQILWVEVERLTLRGCAFTWEQHPFVRYFRDGMESLRRFYELHQPRNQIEALLLDGTRVGDFVPVEFPKHRRPWSFEKQFGGEGSLDASHGCKLHGPVSEEKLLYEKIRLDNIRDSVQEHGFLQVGDEFIRFGEILIDDSEPGVPDYRVYAPGGQHRISLLSHLGWPLIPMMPQPSFPWREVRLSDLARWPGVLDGTFSEEAARAYFLAHFRSPTEQLLPGW